MNFVSASMRAISEIKQTATERIRMWDYISHDVKVTTSASDLSLLVKSQPP